MLLEEILIKSIDSDELHNQLMNFYAGRSDETIYAKDVKNLLELFRIGKIDRDNLAQWASFLENDEDIFVNDDAYETIFFLSDIERGACSTHCRTRLFTTSV